MTLLDLGRTMTLPVHFSFPCRKLAAGGALSTREGEGERVPYLDRTLSRSLSLSHSLQGALLASPALSLSSQACSHSHLHFCWTLLHTHLSEWVFSNDSHSHLHPFFESPLLVIALCHRIRSKSWPTSVNFPRFPGPKSLRRSSKGPTSNQRLRVSASDQTYESKFADR